MGLKISDNQARVSWGYEDGPWKSPEPPLLVAANFLKEFFNLCFIGSVGLDDYLTDSSLAIYSSLQSDLVLVVRLAYTN
jgi:hypothetical protein